MAEDDTLPRLVATTCFTLKGRAEAPESRWNRWSSFDRLDAAQLVNEGRWKEADSEI